MAFGLVCPQGANVIGVDPSFRASATRASEVLRASGRVPVLLNTTSGKAAPLVSRLAPEGIDCLYIDGDHSQGACLRDWQAYYPLVKPGGLILVHDVANPHCPFVVQDWKRITAAGNFASVEVIAHDSEFLTKRGKRKVGFGVIVKWE